MKKVIFGLFVAVAALSVHAEYLYWSVTGTSGYQQGGDYVSPGNWDYARLMWKDNNGSAGEVTALRAADAATGYNSNLSSVANYDQASYYIELYNYDSAYKVQWTSESSAMTYEQLSGLHAINLNTALNGIANAAMFTGTRVVGTPEPTSGLLLLMGFAMLGLKRKKEV